MTLAVTRALLDRVDRWVLPTTRSAIVACLPVGPVSSEATMIPAVYVCNCTEQAIDAQSVSDAFVRGHDGRA